jgi:hypothetical protein
MPGLGGADRRMGPVLWPVARAREDGPAATGRAEVKRLPVYADEEVRPGRSARFQR